MFIQLFSDDKLEMNEMSWACSMYEGEERACSMYGERRGVYMVLVGRPKGRSLLGRT